MKLIIDIPEEEYELIVNDEACGLNILTRAIANGIPFQEICDRENSEIKNEVKDLSKRVENIEKQMKKDKEEQLNKLKAEIECAKFQLRGLEVAPVVQRII